jgi:uracil-DNA glycosylase
MKDLYHDLAEVLKTGKGRPVVRSRGDAEAAILTSFLRGKRSGVPGIEPQTGTGVREAIRTCRKCKGVVNRKYAAGSGTNGVMVILNPPSLLHREERSKYRRESAEMLRKMLAAIGVDLAECYTTGLVKCETDEPGSTTGAMFSGCDPHLNAEIAEVTPRVIIVMGDIKPLKRTRDGHCGIEWFSVDHPITLLNNPDLKRRAWSTLKLVKEAIDGARR